ncbi:glycoside hydrolase domain-containing protein [Ligilactobacillus agilis]|uniref:glycoside hydrolase domain-containing protein n=1 Tax=Ligilactobacillus agilis TaxID=1601 RepID=UPI0034E2BD82
MVDQQVLATQKWLNKTYRNVSGFKLAPENGLTGWPTIYSLREALQHELGLTSLGEGFGDATKSALSKQIYKLKEGYKGNIAFLIKGAFWCKGISPVSLDNNFDKDLTRAIKELQTDAGVKSDGILTVNLMAALFDMSAFVLISGRGDQKVRQIQQALNKRYSEELGIMPCDGIYQRATNTALIYHLQRTIGMSANVANGNYGPGTISQTPSVRKGTQGEIVRIIRYGLYVNGFDTGSFSDVFDDSVANEIINFRKFMQLTPFVETADLTVIKGLLTSNGNTSRDSNAIDTATILSASNAQKFKAAGYDIVGRYLTGTVGVGSSKRNKSLSVKEIEDITKAGLRIFPIYEDGGYEIDYFTAKQGLEDAHLAYAAANQLGFPAGTTIYFAVDVDALGEEIDNQIIPYFKAVASFLNNTMYNIGVYGTRNVCLQVSNIKGVKYSFVADMSYGWSGNLGFKMPKNWAFDQFVEFTGASTGIAVDQDGSSGKDKGVAKFEVASGYELNSLQNYRYVNQIVERLQRSYPFTLIPNKVTLSADSPHLYFNTPLASLDLQVKFNDEISAGATPSVGATFNVTNGEAHLINQDEILKELTTLKIALGHDELTASANEIGSTIQNGQVETGQTVSANGLTLTYTIKSTLTYQSSATSTSKAGYELILKITFHKLAPGAPVPVGVTSTELNDYHNNLTKISEGLKIAGYAALGVFIFAVAIEASPVIVAGSSEVIIAGVSAFAVKLVSSLVSKGA